MKCLLLLVFLLLSPTYAETMTPVQTSELRERILANFFVPTPLPALEAKTHRQFKPASGVRAEAVSYATEFGTRVSAILYLPDPLPKGGKIPAFVVIDGHGGDKNVWYSYYTGITYARAGAAVLTYDQAGESERSGQRKSGTREHDRLKGDEAMARRLCGLMITDAMQAVSYLISRPEVDPKRIAAGGYSLGSFVMALTGAVDPRLRACVMVGGGNLDGPDGYWDKSGKPMCQALPYRSLSFLGDRPAVIYALHAEHGSSLMWNGRIDSVVNMPKTQEPFFEDLRARVIKLRGTPEGVFEFGFTPGGSHRPYFVTRPVALWLEKQLNFPNWNEAEIKAMPETHISEWSKQTGVPIDKLYATDEREGGTMAIGTDVPGYKWQDLCLFSPVEWESVKQDYVFATWVNAATEAAAKAK